MAGNEPSREVQAFADALQHWAEQGSKQEREQKETLLRWLLSRSQSRRFKLRGASTDNKYIIKRTPIANIDINKAITDALAEYNPDLPTEGWVQGGPIWTKGYGSYWEKAYG